jgi:molybdopterin-guanine dinucleotide biosynthesis protein A
MENLDRTVIILAGGSSSRLGQDKGLLKLNNKPLLNHVVDAIKGIVDEVLIATSSKERADLYSKILPSNVRFAIDACDLEGPLIGALTGFEAARGKYSLLLSFDAPFVSKEVASLLFELCVGKSAVIPRSPDCKVEPLYAVYHTEQALFAAKKALAENELDVGAMITKMRGVRYVSTLVIEQLDPDLRSFFSVKTPLDLKKAMIMTKKKNKFAAD